MPLNGSFDDSTLLGRQNQWILVAKNFSMTLESTVRLFKSAMAPDPAAVVPGQPSSVRGPGQKISQRLWKWRRTRLAWHGEIISSRAPRLRFGLVSPVTASETRSLSASSRLVSLRPIPPRMRLVPPPGRFDDRLDLIYSGVQSSNLAPGANRQRVPADRPAAARRSLQGSAWPVIFRQASITSRTL